MDHFVANCCYLGNPSKLSPALFGGMKMAKVLLKELSDFLPVLLVFRLGDAELQRLVAISDKEQGG